MALSYEEGMTTLRSIFPTWDAQVLAELLEANDGHLENTIDMALTMEPPTQPTAATASPRAQPRRSPRSSPRAKTPATQTAPRRARVTLPDDFLRLPSDDGDAFSTRPMTEQEKQDAMLARMLQDEIFREQLFEDEEFSAHFHQDPRRGASTRYATERSSMSREKSASEIASETFSAMSVKFNSMSEAMKKKAQEMYLKFQTRSDAPSERDPKSHRPLMAEDSSDEEDERTYHGTADLRHRHMQESSRDSFGSRFPDSGLSRRGTKKND
ncbi:hypothetical protein Poli38472_004248 [Pythium oligandrum]|uniref:CUE domain-containing protein n=1 Tax=Pythium oligandrum TaxID=41045 RepID=A0A8K1CP63_PYTOL|nr:hypothetical protein Poli38472_004248 [Pythium oligandrum]|eukprot:TMW66483.1 hypothetical protein Poli38472_004248 [Pythium oligandrum]